MFTNRITSWLTGKSQDLVFPARPEPLTKIVDYKGTVHITQQRDGILHAIALEGTEVDIVIEALIEIKQRQNEE